MGTSRSVSLGRAALELGFTDGIVFPLRCAAPDIARFFVMLAVSQFLGLATAFEQLAEPTQRSRDRLSLVVPQPQRHAQPLNDAGTLRGGKAARQPSGKLRIIEEGQD